MDEKNIFQYMPLPEPIPITEQVWPKGTMPIVHTRTMTYNHENFIRDCIEGILMQKTTFPVQVLIHDDASTDKTPEIVKEYQQRYPRLIKAYFQVENSYSKPDKHERRTEFMSWRVGKYEALCEGDDFWTDPYKLQKQVNKMEENPNCNISFHPVKTINGITGTPIGTLGNIDDKSIIISARNVLRQGITIMPTCSLLVKNSFIKQENFFSFMQNHGSSFFLKFLAAIDGGSLFINDRMGVYRVKTENSHTWKVRNNPTFALKNTLRVINAFELANKLTNYQYSTEINSINVNSLITRFQQKGIDIKTKRKVFKEYKYIFNLFQFLILSLLHLPKGDYFFTLTWKFTKKIQFKFKKYFYV